MTLTEASDAIGRMVVYRTPYGMVEQGVITSVNDRYVFVRYGSDYLSKATEPLALELVDGS